MNPLTSLGRMWFHNGRFKWAIFLSVLLSIGFVASLLLPENAADKTDVLLSRKFNLQNDLEIRRQWMRLDRRVKMDTMGIVEKLRLVDSLLAEGEK